MKTFLLLILSQLLAFWPVCVWYVSRLRDGSDEPYGILAFLVVIVVVIFRKKIHTPPTLTIVISILLTILYAFTKSSLPLLFQGVLMNVSLAVLISGCCFNSRLNLAITGLLVLSLPLIASLQFFLGFPVRIITSELSAHLLSLGGIPVSAQGTMLIWRGEPISIDAPCAGIKMLWSGLFLHFTLSSFKQLRNAQVLLGYTLSMICIFGGNLLRTLLLFFTESKIVSAPEWAHNAIGILCFSCICLAILFLHRRKYLCA